VRQGDKGSGTARPLRFRPPWPRRRLRVEGCGVRTAGPAGVTLLWAAVCSQQAHVTYRGYAWREPDLHRGAENTPGCRATCAAQGLDEVFKCANTQVGVAATQVGVRSMCAPVPGAVGTWSWVQCQFGQTWSHFIWFALVCPGGDVVLHDAREWSHGCPCLAGGPGEEYRLGHGSL